MDVIRSPWLDAARDELDAWRLACNEAPDVLALVIESRLGAVPHPFLVQIGANDGVRDDDLRPHLLTGRWSGILVEPQPGPFARLQRNYAHIEGLAFENCAISSAPGTLTLYGFSGHAGDAQLDVFTRTDRDFIARLGAELEIDGEIERFDVPASTYAELLARHGSPRVDLLVIDTEGHDGEILRSLDLRTAGPPVIQFEHMNLSARERLGCYRLLVEHGYRLLPHRRDTVAVRDISAGSG